MGCCGLRTTTRGLFDGNEVCDCFDSVENGGGKIARDCVDGEVFGVVDDTGSRSALMLFRSTSVDTLVGRVLRSATRAWSMLNGSGGNGELVGR